MIIPVILSGGTGTRLWPLSDENKPKQFVKLLGNDTLFSQTLARFSNKNIFPNPIILSNVKYQNLIDGELKKNGLQKSLVLMEPLVKNTAPAIAVATNYLEQNGYGEEIVIFIPSDAYIDDAERFVEFLCEGEKLAQEGKILCFGIRPNNPETGYGYIKTGDKIGNNTYQVENFIEKPPKEEALEFLKNRGYLWNAGIFMSKVSTLAIAFAGHAEHIWNSVTDALLEAKIVDNHVYLDKSSYGNCENISVDYAIMEKLASEQLAVISMDVIWSDVGSYKSLFDMNQAKNLEGNLLLGEAEKTILQNTENCFIYAEDKIICCSDLKDLVVVQKEDYVLVMDRSRSQNLRELVSKVEERKEKK